MARTQETQETQGTGPAGIAAIDKPLGLTSHDVVARVRRLLGMKRVGHAGTLDPMATGVLVVAVGEATKLTPFLTLDDKSYLATVRLGRATDTLDAEGQVIAEVALPPWWPDEPEAARRIDAALVDERDRREQLPPRYSAIKVQGRPAYARARRGEEVALEPRPVAVRRLELLGKTGDCIELGLTVSKGYYVRALARDLGDRLGLPAHLAALRRTASGVFTLADCVSLDERLAEHLVPMTDAARRALPTAALTEDGARRARAGAALGLHDFDLPPPQGAAAWLDPGGRLVAIGRGDGTRPTVVRGFASLGP